MKLNTPSFINIEWKLLSGEEEIGGDLKFNTQTGKLYSGQKSINQPISIVVESNIAIQIEKARIYSEPNLIDIFLPYSPTNKKHVWGIPLIIENKELLGEFPIKLVFEYEYN